MKKILTTFCLLVAFTLSFGQSKQILFTNVKVFNGTENALLDVDVLVEGNLIKQVAKGIKAPSGAQVVDGGGRTLMPGLIDAHVHLSIIMPIEHMMTEPQDYVTAITLQEAEAQLMRGYTTVRDASGAIFGIKKAIDEGRFPGPRIYPCGSAIGMTGGHYDFRANSERPRVLGGNAWSDGEFANGLINVDGVAEVLAASRLQFRKGAAFLKMATSGSIEGVYDPLMISEFSYDEIKAAADEAKRWGSYLAVHCYTDDGVQTSLEAGAMSIEHANLISDETAKLIKDKGAYLSTQTGIFQQDPPDYWNEDMKAKQLKAHEGLDNLMKMVKKYNLKIAVGTDLVGSMEAMEAQKYELSNRLEWFTPFEILTQALTNNAELLSWTGIVNPYPHGKLGVIAEGAYADILLVNGNPLKDLKVFNNPEENLKIIMKDGKIYKNTTK